jgi:hypothetical protein
LIQGFGAGDTITVSNAAAAAYSFARDTNAGNDIVITYNNDGKINEIVLQGAATGSTGALETLASVEALLGAGFFKAVGGSGGSGGSGGDGGTQPFVPTATVGIDTVGTKVVEFNAGTGSIKYSDDVGQPSNVLITNFGSDDRIFTNTAAINFNFTAADIDGDGVYDDLEITYKTNDDVNNQFILDGVLAGKDDILIENYATAVIAVGFEFMNFG